jgi:enoyl-CoA hydratase
MSMKVTYDIDGPVGRITLANPPTNTLTHPAFADEEEMARFLAAPSLKAVIVAGEGRHFSAGADLDSLRAQARDAAGLAEALGRGKALLDRIRFAPVPVIAAIRGSCLGAGLEIALACHFRVAAESAMLGFPESEQGLIPGLAGTLADSVRRGALVRLVLSGGLVSGQEALALGLVDRAVPVRAVEREARALADSLTGRRSAELVHAAMASIGNAGRMPRDEALRRETELFCELARRQASAGQGGGAV